MLRQKNFYEKKLFFYSSDIKTYLSTQFSSYIFRDHENIAFQQLLKWFSMISALLVMLSVEFVFWN